MLADASQRFHKLIGASNTLFSTGTDEHGLKVQQVAENFNKDPFVLCSEKSSEYRKLFDSVNIGYTDYIRTTEERHLRSVNHIFNKLNNAGYIYKGNYDGWYCVSDEQFLTKHQVQDITLENGETKKISSESGHYVEWVTETNYMFKLSELKNDLLYWIKDSERVKPAVFHQLLERYINEDLHDLSFSRPKNRVSWGIPIPNDPDHILYVWVDALINYLTVSGFPEHTFWPPTIQVLGKDILKFHGIYWPAILIASGLEPPKKLLVHSHWTVDGRKMSKSLGNVVCPNEMIKKLSVDGLRYCLLRMGTPHSDSSWNTEAAIKHLNADLANALGNLVSRCRPKSLNPDQIMPSLCLNFYNESSKAKQIQNLINELPISVAEHYNEFNFYKGLQVILQLIHVTNELIEEEKPWTLKNNTDKTKLHNIIHISLSSARAAGIALQPIVPNIASSLLDSLGVPKNERLWQHINKYPSVDVEASPLGPKQILFQRIKNCY